MQVDQAKLKEIALKHGIPMLEEALLEVLFPLIKEAFVATENKVDDAVWAVVEPMLKELIKAQLEKK